MDRKEEKKFIQYFKWQPKLGYELYLKFENQDMVDHLDPTLKTVGFEKIDEKDVKSSKIFSPKESTVITIKKASHKLNSKINFSNGMFDSFAEESVYTQGYYNIYRFKGAGLLIFAESKFEWELALKYNGLDLDKFRVMLTRLISFALAPQGVVGFWGVPVDEGVVIRRALDTKFESVFVDLTREVLITYDGIQDIECGMQVLRLDQALDRDPIRMRKEELLTFFSSHHTYLSYMGQHPIIKQTLMSLVNACDGFVYPEKRFKPRNLEV